ncbi:uncharacterized protein LOC104440374 [Eucalyptus grandis]|uniref:uncharacterized protein LOC104440374 n=1 Tax=Eucalyptus grandis TaxID=71139 RepID=UPI00192E8A9E|nr:uncharacterized protein LOC104440374 [Eucalyptus grandis]
MEEARKRRADRAADDGGEEGGSAAKKLKPDEASAEPQDDDWISAWLALDDDAVSELLDLLDPAESPPSPSSSSPAAAGGDGFKFKVRFIDDPYASPLVFQSSSSFVTINGNEESCGSSFSESESTVMASIDTRGIGALRAAGGEVGRARLGPPAEAEAEEEGEGGAWATKGSGEARGCCLFGADGDDDDDAAAVVVAGFLGGEEEEMLLTGLK